MRAAVRDNWMQFTSRFEGVVPFFYLDRHVGADGEPDPLVTIAVGNLCEPLGEYVLELPLVHRGDWSLASRDEIALAWHAVKSRPDLSARGWTAFRELSDLILTPEGIRALVFGKLDSNEAHLVARFPCFADWPCDAQMAIHSWAWADGPNGHAPHMEAALRADPPDFATAAVEVHLDDTHNAGLRPRNAANRILFQNAATVRERGLDPDVLYHPRELAEETQPAADA